MRTFRLVRDEDVSGVSGTGVVVVGVVFPSGKAVIEWLPGKAGVGSLAVYDDVASVERIHGHDGATRLEWLTETRAT